MGQPDIRSLLVTGPLQNVSIAYRNAEYVGDRVAKILDIEDPKAKIAIYPRGAWFRDEAEMRGPGGEAKRGGYPIDWATISTKEFAFAAEVTDEDRRLSRSQMAPPLKPDQDALDLCGDKIDLSKERRVFALVNATNWSAAGAGGEDAAGLWAPNDATNTFIDDVETRIETIRSAIGRRPNVLVLSGNTYSKVKQLSAVQAKIQYVERAIVTAPMLAALFQLEEVLIAGAIYSSAAEKKDASDFTSVNIWEANAGKGSAFLFYRPATVGLKTPMALCQARLRYSPEEGGQVRRTTTWREASRHQDVYEVAEETHILATGTYGGFMWKDTILT
jgi:hypothetical protein